MLKVFRPRARPFVVLICAALATASCSSSPVPTAAEAGPQYQQLSTDISDTLAAKFPGEPWLPVDNQQTRLNQNNDGKCFLSIGTLRSQDSLPELAGGWEAVMDAINPVLQDSGFAEIKDTGSIKGGWQGISSTDASGGELRIASKGYTDISVTAEVSDTDCAVSTD